MAPYTMMSCMWPGKEGNIKFISGIPGCSEKSRKTTTGGEQVTYQMSMPVYGSDSPFVKQMSYTMATTRKDGKIATLTTAEGDSIEKAAETSTAIYNLDSPRPMTVAQFVSTRKVGNKKETFVLYDENMCAKLRATGSDPRMTEMARMCASQLAPYQAIIAEYTKKFARENKKLGYRSFDSASYDFSAGYMGGSKTELQEARGGTFTELATIMGNCGIIDPGGGLQSPVQPPNPIEGTPQKPTPALREASPNEG